MIKWEARPSPYLYSDDWTGETEFGRVEVTRVSHKVLGTPWRVLFPTGNTLRVENADVGKQKAESWLARQLSERGRRHEGKENARTKGG